jgi:hypothetical protein
MKWAGLVTNASPYEVPQGCAVTQVNLQVLAPGQLTVRPGHMPVSFASTSGSTSRIITAFRYPKDTDGVVYQDATGRVFISRGPS